MTTAALPFRPAPPPDSGPARMHAMAAQLAAATTPDAVQDCISRFAATVPLIWDLAAMHAPVLDRVLVRRFLKRDAQLGVALAANPALAPSEAWIVAGGALAAVEAQGVDARLGLETLLTLAQHRRLDLESETGRRVVAYATSTLQSGRPQVAGAALKVLLALPMLPAPLQARLAAAWHQHAVSRLGLASHPSAEPEAWVRAMAGVGPSDVAQALTSLPHVWGSEVVQAWLRTTTMPGVDGMLGGLLVQWQQSARFTACWRLVATRSPATAAPLLSTVCATARRALTADDLMPVLESRDPQIRFQGLTFLAEVQEGRGEGGAAPVPRDPVRRAVVRG
jgi:hypothetical protein